MKDLVETTRIAERLIRKNEVLDRDNIASVIADKLHSIGLYTSVKPSDLPAAGKMYPIKSLSIDPKTVGLLQPVFKKIDCAITAGYDAESEIISLVLDYHWQHPRGSNGYMVRYKYVDKKWIDD